MSSSVEIEEKQKLYEADEPIMSASNERVSPAKRRKLSTDASHGFTLTNSVIDPSVESSDPGGMQAVSTTDVSVSDAFNKDNTDSSKPPPKTAKSIARELSSLSTSLRFGHLQQSGREERLRKRKTMTESTNNMSTNRRNTRSSTKAKANKIQAKDRLKQVSGHSKESQSAKSKNTCKRVSGRVVRCNKTENKAKVQVPSKSRMKRSASQPSKDRSLVQMANDCKTREYPESQKMLKLEDSSTIQEQGEWSGPKQAQYLGPGTEKVPNHGCSSQYETAMQSKNTFSMPIKTGWPPCRFVLGSASQIEQQQQMPNPNAIFLAQPHSSDNNPFPLPFRPIQVTLDPSNKANQEWTIRDYGTTKRWAPPFDVSQPQNGGGKHSSLRTATPRVITPDPINSSNNMAVSYLFSPIENDHCVEEHSMVACCKFQIRCTLHGVDYFDSYDDSPFRALHNVSHYSTVNVQPPKPVEQEISDQEMVDFLEDILFSGGKTPDPKPFPPLLDVANGSCDDCAGTPGPVPLLSSFSSLDDDGEDWESLVQMAIEGSTIGEDHHEQP